MKCVLLVEGEKRNEGTDLVRFPEDVFAVQAFVVFKDTFVQDTTELCAGDTYGYCADKATQKSACDTADSRPGGTRDQTDGQTDATSSESTADTSESTSDGADCTTGTATNIALTDQGRSALRT